MTNLIDFVSQPWLGSVLGILGLCAAVFFYFRSRKTSRIAYQSDGVTILGSSVAAFPEELEIRFSGVPVPRVTAERLALWNAGNMTIGGEQIVSSDPLRVEVEEGSEILKIDILKTTREVNAFKLSHREESKRIVDINFQYLDPGDGLSLNILHSGDRGDLELLETVRGIPSGVSNYGRGPWSLAQQFARLPIPFKSVRTFFVIILVIGLFIMLFGLLAPYLVIWFPKLSGHGSTRDIIGSRWPAVAAGALYVIMATLALWIRRKRYPALLDGDKSAKETTNVIAEPSSAANRP